METTVVSLGMETTIVSLGYMGKMKWKLLFRVWGFGV